jgi:cupin 2 domain-containing protein
MIANLYSGLPEILPTEITDVLVKSQNVRIERIVSQGHSSPETGWYDQDDNEWVVVLQGAGTIQFDDNSKVTLQSGDHINIPAHKKHKVAWTDPDQSTVWLAVFY